MIHWIALETPNQVEEVMAKHAALDEAFLIFKHSTRCPLSASRKASFESSFDLISLPTYLLKVVEHRPASNFIEQVSGITHESPQLLAFKGKSLIHHASHFNIKLESLKASLQN